MTMYKALHPRDDIDTLYASRKEERSRLANIEGSIDASRQRLEDYIEKCWERLIIATRNNTNDITTNRPEITRKHIWDEKQLYGRFKWLYHSGTKKKQP